jgi:hypothetical protein
MIFHSFLFAQETQTPEPQDPPKLKSNFVYAGYSALLPGLGQAKKDRLFTGLFFFSAFGASLYNYKVNLDRFHEAEKGYKESTQALSILNSASSLSQSGSTYYAYFLISSSLANQSFAWYTKAERDANQAVLYAVGIYLIQIGHAFFCSPGSSFDKPVESKSLESSRFNFNLYPTRNQFGQTGTNVDVNYTWRF